MNSCFSYISLLLLLALATSIRAASVVEEQHSLGKETVPDSRNPLNRFDLLSKEQREELDAEPLTRKEQEVVAALETDLSKLTASAAAGSEFGGVEQQSHRKKRMAAGAGPRIEGANGDERYSNCVLRQCVEVYNWCFQNCYGIIDFKIKYRCLYHICPRNLQLCVQYCDRIREH